MRIGADVVSLTDDGRSVRLRTGENVHADIIVGADGKTGITRRTLMEGLSDAGRDTGLIMFE